MLGSLSSVHPKTNNQNNSSDTNMSVYLLEWAGRETPNPTLEQELDDRWVMDGDKLRNPSFVDVS